MTVSYHSGPARRTLRFARTAGVISALTALSVAPAAAQSSFSAEIVDRGAVWAQFDFLAYVASRQAGGWEWYSPRVTAGVANGLEVGVAYSALTPSDASERAAVMPGFKWRPFAGVGGMEVAVGATASIPARSPRNEQRWGMAFATADFSVGDRMPQLTAGAYGIVGSRSGGDSRRGVILALSQPIGSAFEFTADWVSGDNFYGYFTPAVTFSYGRSWLYAGYSVGNQREGNSGPALGYGIAF